MSFLDNHQESPTDPPRTWPSRYNAMLEALDNATLRRGRAEVDAAESTTTDAFVDLTTHGPEVTLTVGPAGMVVVLFSALIQLPGSGSERGSVSFESTGAAAESPHFRRSIRSEFNGRLNMGTHDSFHAAPGESLTVTMKYRSETGGSITFQHRRLTVLTW